MAFLENVASDKKERFSLLQLDPGEIYFEDFSVFYIPKGVSEQEINKKKLRGRLKVCSKSLVFVPSESKHPILKFLFRDITKIEECKGSLISRLEGSNKMIRLECGQVIEMKESDAIAPYVFKKAKFLYVFLLNYVMVDDSLPQMCQLHRASTLPLADQTAMINAIVLSRQSRVKFDTSWLEDLYETIVLESQGDRITPLVTNPGRIMLTSSRLYFQPFNNVDPVPVLKINLSGIKRIVKRRFLLRQVGIEVYCPGNSLCSHLYLALKNEAARNQLYACLISQQAVSLEDTGQENMTLKWQNGVISNFEYLMFLNSMADRSFNDLTQYPVFPWVVSDYTSCTLDLNDVNTFRDLSKPIGALNEERLARLKERCRDMPEPKFLYGSHYSTPGYVLFYLARVAPEYVLCLQNGRFDQPDRMFNSIMDAWKNCLEGASDFKELIAEFYDSSGDFLVNNQLINFGSRQDGRQVNTVDLPPWASDPRDFVMKMSAALESDYVSSHLHHWIDLIFGYKQRGKEAELADNLFYYLTYEGALDLESIKDWNERAAMEAQIMEFGQTPKQLFQNPHPKRFSGEVSLQNVIPSNSAPAIVSGTSDVENGPSPVIDTNAAGEPEGELDAQITANFADSMSQLQPYLEHKLHKGCINDLKWAPDGRSVFSVSQDTLLKVYSVEDQRQLRSVNLSTMAISSCVVMPDGNTIVVGCWDNNIYIYSMEYGRILDTVYAHDDAVSGLCWQQDLLVSSSWDSTVKLWNFKATSQPKKTMEQLAELDHDTGVNCISLNKDGSHVVSGTKEGQILLWDVASQTLLNQFHAHSDVINSVLFSPDGLRLVSCSGDHYLRVVDISTGTEVYAKDAGEELRCLAWDGCTAVAGASSGHLLVWDLLKGQVVYRTKAHQGALTCVDVGEGHRVVTGGEDKRVILWKT